ncbi:MAG: hypothetical protein K6T83_01355 [Alicyclobacillus sp.]|nr:hypothetical protein [Alicyclobacillus sp.]
MGKVDADSLSQVLGNLTCARHKVQAAVLLVTKCGPLALPEQQIVDVRERLCNLTEIAAALMDAKQTRGE